MLDRFIRYGERTKPNWYDWAFAILFLTFGALDWRHGYHMRSAMDVAVSVLPLLMIQVKVVCHEKLWPRFVVLALYIVLGAGSLVLH